MGSPLRSELLVRRGATKLLKAVCPIPELAHRLGMGAASAYSNFRAASTPADDSMPERDTDAMISIAGGCWRFPSAQIELDSEFEWRNDGKLFLHDGAGNVVEGIELGDARIEQMCRGELLADVLEIAAKKLRSGIKRIA